MIKVINLKSKSRMVQVVEKGNAIYKEIEPNGFIYSEVMTDDLGVQQQFKYVKLVHLRSAVVPAKREDDTPQYVSPRWQAMSPVKIAVQIKNEEFPSRLRPLKLTQLRLG